jgi:Protein of unknown function (DUF2892)
MYLADTSRWHMERVIRLIAGGMILFSLILSQLFSPYWLILTALVGVNLTILAFTGFCPMTVLLHWLGVRPQSELSANKG